MTVLVLARHGETVWAEGNRYAGGSDVELTPNGEAQARQLAEWARTAELTGIWSSDLQRARLTAEACAEVTGLPVKVDARLRELDFGRGEGLTPEEMAAAFPDALDAFHRDPVANPLPGGEDPVGALERFTQSLDDIAEADPDGRVLVVAHGTVIRLRLCRLLGAPPREYRRLFPSMINCARTEITSAGQLLNFNVPATSS
ncbi:alpha-ribazole phosphatase [Pseudonocardia eucalypti]|uniref:Alpha-ribazole phosphatase n=1 Tax=Pseudonocardia eucalypti TaxID=648755 RepID=A0ABP9PCE3_9PSEU|nr:putative phosphoglycerate mutase [Pseudonocardia eucalypti]